MKDKYEVMSNGVIKQVSPKKIEYNIPYVQQRYDTIGELGPRMAHLRYAYMIGTLGFIPSSILDVGYGNGDFLKVCQQTIHNCFGNDVSGYSLPTGCVFRTDITEPVDVVTFFDSLEHFEDISFMKNMQAKYVVISVPWCHNFSEEWFERWKHRRPDEHLFHFNKISLEAFMKESGYVMLSSLNVEDIIRKSSDANPNILTAIFKKEA